MKYGQISDQDFGFGSPSPTYKLIKTLEDSDKDLAIELNQWVANNGGNYYIPQNEKEI